jgi:hypothetical protein
MRSTSIRRKAAFPALDLSHCPQLNVIVAASDKLRQQVPLEQMFWRVVWVRWYRPAKVLASSV